MTNSELITDALRLLGVLDEIQSASSEQGATSLRKLNQMMANWREDAIDLGYFAQSDLTASCPVPDWAEQGVTGQLALLLAPVYQRAVTLEVAKQADDGMATILRRLMNLKLEGADMSHLPQGDGRYGRHDITTDR